MDYDELIDALTDSENPNRLDYIDDAVRMIDELRMEAKGSRLRCETTEKMLSNYQDEIVPRYRSLAENATVQQKNLERALAHMWYAYENKDAEFPHEYEKEAVKEAEQLLGKWEDVMPKLLKEE